MTDIVERLRDLEEVKSCASLINGCPNCGIGSNTVREAADEIEILRLAFQGLEDEKNAEIERLREVNELLQGAVKLLKEQVNMQKEAINDTRKILRGET